MAGVSHAAPYRHFVDKDALLAAIAEQGFRLLTAHMIRSRETPAPAPTARGRLRALGLGYVGFAVENPAYLRVIFGGLVNQERVTPALKEAGDEAYRLLYDEVATGIARGELRGGDADRLSLAAWSMVHGLANLIIDRAVDVPGPAVVPPAGAMPDLLLTGLAASGAAHDQDSPSDRKRRVVSRLSRNGLCPSQNVRMTM